MPFDTGGFNLWKHGFALRVRNDGKCHVQTLKGDGSAVTGLRPRIELEAEIPFETSAHELFAKRLGEALPHLVHCLGGRQHETSTPLQLCSQK